MLDVAIPSFSPKAVQTPKACSSKNCCIFLINSIIHLSTTPENLPFTWVNAVLST